MMYICGLLLTTSTFVRLCEPTIKDAFVDFLRQSICCKNPKGKYKAEGSLTTFLNSSINVEYVYLILTSLERVMKQRHLLV